MWSTCSTRSMSAAVAQSINAATAPAAPRHSPCRSTGDGDEMTDQPPGPPALYDLDGVTIAVDGRPIIDGLSFSLAAGKVYALVGPNGSGKSTLIRALAGQQRPAAGEIRLQGRPVG